MAKKQQISPEYITKDELKILARVSQDVFMFSEFCYVVNPIKGKVQFKLYPYQKAVLYQFVKERFNIILKFRQAGITELISMYCLWLAMYHENKKINIISIKDITAKKVLKKIKFMYKNLPYYLKTPIINGRANEIGSSSLIEFNNGSFIESIPTSPEAGRSESLTLLVIDEAAMVRWANDVFAAAAPTLACLSGSYKPLLRKYIKIPGRNRHKWEIFTERIKNLCPKEKGIDWEFSKRGYQVLSGDGSWQDVLFTQNKGKLLTWKLKDSRGKVIHCTPEHKFLTPNGWKTAREIISKQLEVTQIELNWNDHPDPPKVKKPIREIKQVPYAPTYYVSNHGELYHLKSGKLVSKKLHHVGPYKVTHLRSQGKVVNKKMAHLVYELFIGPIPKGKVIDHIDCNKDHNWSTNLQAITVSENTKRGILYNPQAFLGQITDHVNPLYISKIKKLLNDNPTLSDRQIAIKLGDIKQRKYVGKIRKGLTRVYFSKLTFISESYRTIYDITVNNTHSYLTTNNYINHNTGGSAIINSTPRGLGNFYHSTWVDAVSGHNGMNPIRLYWDMHPERDQDWYDKMSKILGPKRTAQEIDGDFLSSGNTVFDLADIKAIEDCLSDYPVIKTRFNGQYRQFLEPNEDESYYIGADVATGRSNDYSSFTLMNRAGEEFAVFKGRMSVDKYARLLGDTGQLFNFAKIAPETNDVGLAVTSLLQTEGYPNLYFYQKLLKKKNKSRPETDLVPGWITTNHNRPIIIEALERDIREEAVIIKDPFFVQEAYTFIYDTMGRPVALNKHKSNTDSDLEDDAYSDDDIFGKAICNHIRKQRDNISTLPV